MIHTETSALGHEWATLQNNYEQYEKNCLLIKLGSTALFVFCLVAELHTVPAAATVLILWIQEGIFRTYQSRLGERILRVEKLLRETSPQVVYAHQLHTEWQASRPGFGGLLVEYAKSMLRPTVAFPYLVLILMLLSFASST